jgi:AcrR family transcriptional regulator
MSDMTSTADAPRSPGRPRSVRADEAIVEATLDLLAEGNTIETLSIEAIAARAGVGKATIYRRWSGKEALLRDALRTLKGTPPEPTGRSVRDDLSCCSRRGPACHYGRRGSCLPDVVNRAKRTALPDASCASDWCAVLRRGVHSPVPADHQHRNRALPTGPMLVQRRCAGTPELDGRPRHRVIRHRTRRDRTPPRPARRSTTV